MGTTTTRSSLRPGDRLPNGAMVLHATETESQGVVLAYTGGVQPFVTWRYAPGHPDSTGAGHYTNDLAEAVRDYAERGGETYERNLADRDFTGDEPLVAVQVCADCLDAPTHGFGGEGIVRCRYCAACCPTHT
jgi:hypothetical protein